jgi:hypothetical protein
VDFKKIREDRQKQMASTDFLKKKEEKAVANSNEGWRKRISHQIDYHLHKLNDWEEGFIYSVKEWVFKNDLNRPTSKQAAIIEKMEANNCVYPDCTEEQSPPSTPPPNKNIVNPPKNLDSYDDSDFRDDIPY